MCLSPFNLFWTKWLKVQNPPLFLRQQKLNSQNAQSQPNDISSEENVVTLQPFSTPKTEKVSQNDNVFTLVGILIQFPSSTSLSLAAAAKCLTCAPPPPADRTRPDQQRQ